MRSDHARFPPYLGDAYPGDLHHDRSARGLPMTVTPPAGGTLDEAVSWVSWWGLGLPAGGLVLGAAGECAGELAE
jgi:hypothetical protein